MSKYYREYEQFVLNETRIPRVNIKQKNIYEIQLYKKRDNTIKRGFKSGEPYLIFVIGIYDGMVHSLKLNDVDPDDFFDFLIKLKKPNINISELRDLDSALRKTEPSGTVFFQKYIKNSNLYRKYKDVYRVFSISGIQYIKELKLTEDVYRTILKIRD